MPTVKISGISFDTDLPKSAIIDARKALSHAQAATKSQLKNLAKLVHSQQKEACSELVGSLSTSANLALVAAFEAARRCPTVKRPPLERLFGLAGDDPLSSRYEPAHIFLKKNSDKERVLSASGPRKRTAQMMAKMLLSPFYVPRSFQFTSVGVSKAIDQAALAMSAGFVFTAKLDIKKYFASFDSSKLVPELPLPPGWVENVLTGRHLVAVSHSVPSPTIIAARQGLLQGAISSPIVSEITIARLEWQLAEDVQLVNYADDFLILSKSEESAYKYALLLSYAVEALPGGNFKLMLKAFPSASNGVSFLGHHLCVVDGQSRVSVSFASGQKFHHMLSEIGKPLDQVLPNAKNKAQAAKLIAQQLTYAQSWKAAFASCEDVGDYWCVALNGITSSMQYFGLSTAEVDAAINKGHKLRVSAYDLE